MKYEERFEGEAFDLDSYPEDALFFFDFDGVLADQYEEKMVKLPVEPSERRRLTEIADLAGFGHDLYPTHMLRHHLYQGMTLGGPIEPHVSALRFLHRLHDKCRPYYIVTARSGYWAVRRMMAFLETNGLMPHEVFCLGRSSKAQLLSELRTDWPDKPFVFFEDSERHIEACRKLDVSNLTVEKVLWDQCDQKARTLRNDVLGVRDGV